jgi:protein XagA
MKRCILSPSVALLLVVAAASTSFAGAWTAGKNTFYEKFAFNYYYSHESFDSSGQRGATANGGKFTDYDLSNYLEYGLRDDLTLITSLTYKWLENDNNSADSRGYGLGDVDLGLRYKLLDQEKIGIISTQLLVKIPGPYSTTDPLPLGNGQFDTEFRLLYGRSLYHWFPGYANLEIGYRLRAGDPSDELRYLVEVGADLTTKLFARLKLDGTYSMNKGSSTDSNGNPTATNNFDLGKLDLTVGYKLTPTWGIEVSYRPDIYGQNTAAGANYSLALFYKSAP